MIKIKCLTGPYAGQIREAPENQNPLKVLVSMVELGWQWEIDFSLATRDETVAWGGADLMARAVRAVKEGRGAFFMGVEYSTMEDLQVFEDEIVSSGYYVQVASDDHNGLVIYTVNPE